MFRVRVDIKNEVDPVGVVEDNDQYVIVKHLLPHGNPHYHFYIKPNKDYKINAYRQRIKRFFGVDTDEYSVKQCDAKRVNEYLQYLFNSKHGNTSSLHAHNISENEIQQAIEGARLVQQDFEERQTKRKNESSNKPTIYDMAEEIYELAHNELQNTVYVNQMEDYVDYQSCEPHAYVPVFTRHAIKVLQRNRQPFDYFYLRKVIITATSMDSKLRRNIEKRVLKYFLENE